MNIRNLHEQEIEIIENDLVMGMRFLGAYKLNNDDYIYHAPETGMNYLITDDEVKQLGRVVWAIAKQHYICPKKSLSPKEIKVYADPDGDDCLCDYGYAYSIWCSRTGAQETDRDIPDLVFISDT